MVKAPFFMLIMASFVVLNACDEVLDLLVEKEPDSITVTKNPTRTVYNVNETFNSAGLEVTAAYADGSSKVITGYTLSKPNMSSAGTKRIIVTFRGKTTGFDITVTVNKATLISITVTQNPAKTAYYVNQVFNPAGLVVRASYSDGSSKIITDYTLSKPDMSSPGTRTITVTAGGQTAHFDITVTAAGTALASIAVTEKPTKTAYYVNQVFDPAGLEVTASYSDGSSSPVTGYTLSTPDMSGAGTKTITVTFEGKTTQFAITVSVVDLAVITVTQNPVKTVYFVNEAFDSAGLVVTAFYADGSSNPVTGYTLSTPDMSGAGTREIIVTFGGKTAHFYITVHPINNDTGDLGVIVY